jgi:hypothetical protein
MSGTSFADPTASFPRFSNQAVSAVTDDRCFEKAAVDRRDYFAEM